MNETERRAEDHFRRSEWLKALECFEKLLAAGQNNKNGNCIFPKEKLIAFLIGKSECNLALGRNEHVPQDCRRALKLFVEGSNELNGWNKDRARRLLLKALVSCKRYAEADTAVKEWLMKGKVQSDTRKILEQIKNRFENQVLRGQAISVQKLEEDMIALEASLSGSIKINMAHQDRIKSSNDFTSHNGSKSPGSDFSCSYCSVRFPDANALRAHCQTGSHQTIIMSDEGRDWKYRPPPRGLTADAYSLCEGYEEKHGSCRYGEKCVDAHGNEELAEWRERFEYRRMKMQRASEKQLYGKSYTEMILEKWINATSPDNVMRDRIENVEESISGDLVTSVSHKKSECHWTFIMKSPLKLRAIALLQDAHRNHFSIKQVLNGDATTLSSSSDGKPANDQEWTNGPLTVDMDHWSNGDISSCPIMENCIRVGFKTEIYGTFRQSVVFDFGTEPVLVKHLCVDVVPVTDADKMKEIRKEVTVSSAERWCVDNADIVAFTSTTVPSPGLSILDGDKERRLLETYPTPRADSFTLTQSTVVEKSVTRNNYRDRMHELLYVEEMARYEQVARYNVGTKLQIANCYLLAPNGMANSTAKYAHHGELFALMNLGKDVSEDTSAGRLILNNCSTVFISANQTKDGRDNVKRIVYEALIEDKGKNVIYLRLSAVTVSALGLRPDIEYPCQVQFQLNRIPYCEWHFAIDKIADYKLIFPDTVLEPSIPWSPQRQWNESMDPRLNSKQKEAVIAITSPAQMPLPPILIIGPFGTGKTYTLAQAIKQLMVQPDARILVCTHSNSAADLYIKDYLHPWVEAGNEQARPLRIYYHKRWVATVNQVVQKYCLIEMANGARTFKIPSLEDVMKHRIVVVTLSISMYLSTMGLKKGHFTHILLDEAAQAMECEAIMPLALANERTRIVLAGDHMQLSPELFSQFAKDRNLHVSLLERLYDHYPTNFPCKILLCENYRAHEAIINFTSELFYDQKLISSGKQPRHDKFYPLTFFTTRGEDVQDINSTAFYNCSEVYEVVERVCELRKKWPVAWGKLEDHSIGIMTPYADQVFRIRSELRKRRMGSISVERVLNVQGKQFRAIFLSTVRTRRTCLGADTKPANELDFGFLSNWKLLNTAITRAQSLVAVVGDPVALCSIGRCRKVWERFIEICNDNKSLYGITWSLLRSQLDGVELKKTYTLNPLAPEFIPRALQNESYIKLPTMLPGFGPGVIPSFMATPLNYPMFYYPPPPSQPPPLFPLRPPSVPIPYHIGAPNPWPAFNSVSPTGKKEEPKAIMNIAEPKSPVLMDMASINLNLDALDIPPQGIILDNFLRPAPLQLHTVSERHVPSHMPITIGTPVLRSDGEKTDIQFLNNVHFPERVSNSAPPMARVAPLSLSQNPVPPADWHLLLPPHTTLSEVLESRDLQMNWYRYLATSVSLDVADKFKELVILASEKGLSPNTDHQVAMNIIDRPHEINLGPKPLLLRDLEAAIISQAQLQPVAQPPQQQQQQQQQMTLPPPNVPPPNMQQMSVPPPSIPLYRRQATKDDVFLNNFHQQQQQQQNMFMQPPPPTAQPYLNDFHLNGREQEIEEPVANRHNVETTYASVLRAQNNRNSNSETAHDALGVLKNLARSASSHGSSGLYQYFS